MLLKEQIILSLGLEYLKKEEKEKISKEMIEFSLEKAFDELTENMKSEELKNWGDEKVEEEQKNRVIEKVFELFSKHLEENLYEFRTKYSRTS